MRPEHGLRAATYVAYFSLLVSTGLRLSEACLLTTNDVDLVNGILVIRETKFRKSRLVPLHPSTTEALARYADRRDGCRAAPSEYFFRTERSPRLQRHGVEKTFAGIRQRLGWAGHGRARQPRIHDLRHYSGARIIPSRLLKVGGARVGWRIGFRNNHGLSTARSTRSAASPWPAV